MHRQQQIIRDRFQLRVSGLGLDPMRCQIEIVHSAVDVVDVASLSDVA